MKRQQWHQRLIVGVLMFSAVPVVAAPPDRLSRNLFKNGAAIRTVFRPVVSGPSRTTVRVLVNERQRALGAIVGAEGWVVTKASELNGKISCRMKDGAVFPARLVSLHVDHDLALLKIAARTCRWFRGSWIKTRLSASGWRHRESPTCPRRSVWSAFDAGRFRDNSAFWESGLKTTPAVRG